MLSTPEIVRKLSDAEVAALATEVFNIVYTEIPYSEIRSNSESVAEVGSLVSLDSGALKASLPTAESARLGRIVLEQYAADPKLAPIVQEAWERMQKKANKLPIIEAALTLGLLVNLTLLLATTEVHVQKKGGKITWTVRKKKAEPK